MNMMELPAVGIECSGKHSLRLPEDPDPVSAARSACGWGKDITHGGVGIGAQVVGVAWQEKIAVKMEGGQERMADRRLVVRDAVAFGAKPLDGKGACIHPSPASGAEAIPDDRAVIIGFGTGRIQREDAFPAVVDGGITLHIDELVTRRINIPSQVGKIGNDNGCVHLAAEVAKQGGEQDG